MEKVSLRDAVWFFAAAVLAVQIVKVLLYNVPATGEFF
jgi:hypothetical protein